MNDNIFVGIDTSCYTTSFAVSDSGGNIIFNYRKILEVAKGNCGLRQSDAVFAHIKNFTRFFEENDISSLGKIKGVCVSSRPRDVEGSYMPVFLVGKTVAQGIANTHGVLLSETSHQHGHIYAAKAHHRLPGKFIAVHLSGGTSEILAVSEKPGGLDIEIAGGTRDISAGKLVDRLGVALGGKFPAGAFVEKLAKDAWEPLCFKTCVDGCSFNFSGIESLAMKALDTHTENNVCLSVELAVAETISRAVINACAKYGLDHVLLFGGVMCNSEIRNEIKYTLEDHDIKAVFAKKEYSGDNACGLAMHACEVHG